ncbi:YybH family protein [Serpentinicella alkaliphila]|uniref:SnoaL-like protein n=1 Tax=Serpentinicella alkaliphila TaxID=1734049 RepID=A0A4R2TH79_9FIRM|nr:nuclear transport factor 2 family protein [Serpentinicella alkaliphila]QUH26615.1 nuclear transport factor 2 family protein [Serpentinicella alkaliphila]TCQ02920.1 SnoaL-like protein [Serpentinicella alkaliphila]
MDFKSTLMLHLDSMRSKDLDNFLSTVNLNNVVLIMPNGTIIRDKEDFIELHKNWFIDNDWNLNYKILNINEGLEIAYALVDIDYYDCDIEGNIIKMNYYLNLIFCRKEGKWLLTHDQNTIYK